MNIRAFLAIDLSEENRRHLSDVQRQVRSMFGIRASWVRPENFHMTLKFLGDTPESRLEALTASLRQILFQPFHGTISGSGCFPNCRKPRVWWIGLDAGRPLQDLHSAIEDVCEQCGCGRELKAFQSHITLARFKETPKLTEHFQRTLESISVGLSQLVDGFALYESRLDSKGSRYIRRADFAATAN